MADPRTFQIDIGELVDEPNVLFVGALKHTKGPHILLRSLVDVRQQVPGVQATLVGDGPEAEALKKEASALGISNSVSFAGRLHPAELPRLYRKARVLAFPILWEEPFPRVLLEAWAYGTPVVTTTRGAPGELVRDKASGLLVRPGDSKDLARSLALVLEDKSLAERLRRGGREDLRSFLPDVVVPRIIKLYEDLARAGGRAGDGKERWTGIKPGPSTRTI
jgi:glycosyltransferase involved in cell wall biosynthesis